MAPLDGLASAIDPLDGLASGFVPLDGLCPAFDPLDGLASAFAENESSKLARRFAKELSKAAAGAEAASVPGATPDPEVAMRRLRPSVAKAPATPPLTAGDCPLTDRMMHVLVSGSKDARKGPCRLLEYVKANHPGIYAKNVRRAWLCMPRTAARRYLRDQRPCCTDQGGIIQRVFRVFLAFWVFFRGAKTLTQCRRRLLPALLALGRESKRACDESTLSQHLGCRFCRHLRDFALLGLSSAVLLSLTITLPLTPAISSGAPRECDIPICVGKLEFFLVLFCTGASSQGSNFLEIFLSVVGDNFSAICLTRRRAAIHTSAGSNSKPSHTFR